jgi:hypothetical protein
VLVGAEQVLERLRLLLLEIGDLHLEVGHFGPPLLDLLLQLGKLGVEVAERPIDHLTEARGFDIVLKRAGNLGPGLGGGLGGGLRCARALCRLFPPAILRFHRSTPSDPISTR